MAEQSSGQSQPNFWTTMPGILTGVAAVITALGGFLAVAVQAGWLGSEDQPAVVSQGQQQATSPGGPTPTPSSSDTAPGSKPWSEVQATFVSSDGKQTQMRAETVRYCISTGAGIQVDGSQDIAFEKIARIDVLRSDAQLTPGGKADVSITLAGGEIITGTIGSGCDFFGESAAGRYSLYPDKLRAIEFAR